MKLKIVYSKNSAGEVRAEITVVDREDFPSAGIFLNEGGEVGVLMGRGYNSATVNEDKVNALISSVREKLTAWRNIPVPPDREIEL